MNELTIPWLITEKKTKYIALQLPYNRVTWFVKCRRKFCSDSDNNVSVLAYALW